MDQAELERIENKAQEIARLLPDVLRRVRVPDRSDPLSLLLGTMAVLLQAQLWLSEGGYRKTMKLRAAVAEQRAMNERLRERNAALDAEVVNLKQGLEAAEERARTDLGLIGPRETFYQVVPDDAAGD